MRGKLFHFLVVVSLALVGCGDSANQVHIDEKKNATVPCDGGYINNVEIETPETAITYEGVDTIFFNKPTKASRISVHGMINNYYILKLNPNATYTIRTRSHDFDQTPWKKIIKTDAHGNIIHDEDNLMCY